MKKIFVLLFCVIICVKAFSQYPDCNYAKWSEWSEIIDLKEKIQNSMFLPKDEKDQLLSRFEKLKIVVDGFYYCTNEYCKESKELDKQIQLHNNDAADLEADAGRYKAAGCERQDLSESQYASCVAWHNKLAEWSNRIDKRKKELDDWGTTLDKKGYQLLNVEATNNNNAFIKDAKKALSMPVNIVIKRKYKRIEEGCTLGELWINGTKVCKTLELIFDNSKKDSSSIPTGTYYAKIKYSTEKNRWVIELNNIYPNIYYKEGNNWKMKTIVRDFVQIHAGDYQIVPGYNLLGCILVGNNSNKCEFTDSKSTMDKLLNDYFDRNSDGQPDDNLTITVTIQTSY